MCLPGFHLSRSKPKRRRYRRLEIQCGARILIGIRHYSGYLHGISEAGAKLRTITAIRKNGGVLLRLPDLPPLRCTLRWTDTYNAGVSFDRELSRSLFSEWIESRLVTRAPGRFLDCDTEWVAR